MDQLTVRGFDKDLERIVRQLARRERLSLNQAVMRLLRKGAGLDLGPGAVPPNRIGSGLDAFIGTWSAEQAREVAEACAVFDRLDESLWR